MRTTTLLIVLALLLAPALAEEEEMVTITDEDGRNVAVPLDPKVVDHRQYPIHMQSPVLEDGNACLIQLLSHILF